MNLNFFKSLFKQFSNTNFTTCILGLVWCSLCALYSCSGSDPESNNSLQSDQSKIGKTLPDFNSNNSTEDTDESSDALRKPEGTITLNEDANSFRMDPFILVPLIKINADSTQVYDLVIDNKEKIVKESWRRFDSKRNPMFELVLNGKLGLSEINYKYNNEGFCVSKTVDVFGFRMDRNYFYSDSLLVRTHGMHGVMENWETEQRFHYGEQNELLAVDFIEGERTKRKTVSKGTSWRTEVLFPYGASNLIESKILNHGWFNTSVALQLDNATRPAREIEYILSSQERYFWTYYEGEKGQLKTYGYTDDFMVGDDSLYVEFNEEGDTVRSIQFPFDESCLMKEMKYDANKKRICELEQSKNKVRGACKISNNKNEIVSYEVSLDEMKFRIAEKEIELVKEKIGWDTF